MLVTGLVSAYYLGYGISIIISPRFFAMFSRKLLIIVSSIIQGILVASLGLFPNIYWVLILRFLSGLCGTIDIVFKELIDDISIQSNRPYNIVALLLSPRALSMALGCILMSAVYSYDLRLIHGNILALPAFITAALLILFGGILILLLSEEAINLRKAVFTYVEFEGIYRND